MERVPLRGFALTSIVVGVAVGVLLFALVTPSATNPSVVAPVPTSGYWGVGDGLVAVSHLQNVTGTPYWAWFCTSPGVARTCAAPAGVTYAAPADTLVLTEDRTANGGENGILEIDPGTLAERSPLSLNCLPGAPFFPGTGGDAYVPCTNATSPSGGELLVLNLSTESVVSSWPIPAPVYGLAFDPESGLIYAEVGTSQLAVIDPAVGVLSSNTSVAGGSWGLPYPYAEEYQIAFDPVTGELILPAAGAGLLAFDPTTGSVTAHRGLPTAPLALAVDATTKQLFASESNTSGVAVFSASTYRFDTELSFPACFANLCGDAGEVREVLLDASHGDAYLIAYAGLYMLNLSVDAVVGEFPAVGDGPPITATYVPQSDRIFGTYMPAQIGPGFLYQLDHSNPLGVSRLFWLPTDLGSLLLAGVVGTALTVLVFRRFERIRRGARDGPALK